MGIKDRLDLVIKHLGVSGRAFAKECGFLLLIFLKHCQKKPPSIKMFTLVVIYLIFWYFNKTIKPPSRVA